MAVTQSNARAQEIGSCRRSLAPVYAAAVGGLLLYLIAVFLCAIFPHYPVPNDTAVYLYRQDQWLLLAGTGLMLLASLGLRDQTGKLHMSRPALFVIAIGSICVCYFGCKLLLLGYQVSRDEQMAVFDSRIFGSGHLVQALPAFWQGHVEALNALTLPVGRPVAWVSAYLPMNAMLRSLVGLTGDPALTGPLMVALGMFALWKCARILWPEDREAAVVALLLYIGSGQVLFAGMTAYAMPAHLALDLVWLWLFLVGRRGTDLVALLVGFVATGLHQPLFHPLFALPVLFTLLRGRDWHRIALYASGYAAICAFWLAWPIWMHALVAGPHSITAAAGTDYFSRLVQTVTKGDPARWFEMAANLLRFFAWQHVLLVPLIAAALPVIRRDALAAAFAASFLLPVIVMALILPWQGHGFGYRYVHGVLGVAILVAVHGWRRLVVGRSWLRPLLLRTTLGAVLVLLPLQGWMAYSYYAPFARIGRRIETSGADYFIVAWQDAPWARDLVSNRPDLSNRPILLVGNYVDDQLIRNICRPGVRVAMPTSALLRPIDAYFTAPYLRTADDQIAVYSRRLAAAGCTLERLDGS